MAVHTQVSAPACEAFLQTYPASEVGCYRAHEGILAGVENSNFRLATETACAEERHFILTLFERRARLEDLPFFLSFMRHLHARGLPVPLPILRSDGTALGTLESRPAALTTLLPGRDGHERDLEPALCETFGALLARLHAASADFPLTRANDLGASHWGGLLEEAGACLRARGADQAQANAQLLDEGAAVYARVRALWPRAGTLPEAVVHADLFPDNVLLAHGGISGVIDFYFACREMLSYDLAVCRVSWCCTETGAFVPARDTALQAGYDTVRTRDELERSAFDCLSAGAALRFFLTRFLDVLLTPAGSAVAVKDPRPMLRIAQHFADAAEARTP